MNRTGKLESGACRDRSDEPGSAAAAAGEATFLAYLILMTALVLWVLFLLPGHPIRPYVRIFFVGGVLCVIAEGMAGSLLGAYETKARLLSDPDRDRMLAILLIISLLHPLMAVIYVRLARGHPVAVRIAAAVAFGLLEACFVRSGYMVYRLWHPAVSALLFFGFFAIDWQVFAHRWAVPVWMHVLFMAIWLVSSTTFLLHGVLGLWQYPVVARGNPVLGSQLVSMLNEMVLVIPIATLCSGVLNMRRHPVLQVAAGTLALLLVDAVTRATGQVLFIHWNLWLSAVRYAATLGAVALYAHWVSPGKPARRNI